VREAEAMGLDLDVTKGRNPDGYGPSSAIAIVSGPGEERLAALLELSSEIAHIEDRQDVRAGHGKLVRGNPIRRFQGNNFEPLAVKPALPV
jgi:hypothetical protein